jgi:hypothetical protein
MKSQITTRATTLGPFLTLILLASSQRAKAAIGVPASILDEPRSSAATLALQEEVFAEDSPAASSPPTTGPFLRLILSCRQRRADCSRQ